MKLSDISDHEWDDDEGYRELILLLNQSGFQTKSSCAGHAPGTQYQHVQEWMEPYITFIGNPKDLIQLMNNHGFVDRITNRQDITAVRLKRHVDWKQLYDQINSAIKRG